MVASSTPSLSTAEPPPPERPEVEPVDPREVEKIQAVYREILDAVGEGSFDDAAARLFAVESAATDVEHRGTMRALRKAQRRVLDELLRRGPESVFPVMAVHFLTDEWFLREGEVWGAAQNRVFMAEILQDYAKKAGDGADTLGAMVLATLGNTTAALELDPASELGLLRRAMTSEKAGRWEQTVKVLRTLVEAHPESAHGRLRLGINLARTHERADARRVLEEVAVEEGAALWVRIIAVQELANLEWQDGYRGRAERVLRDGIERFDDQKLYLQLAYYLDRTGRRSESISLVNRIPVDEQAEASPRHRYNGAPLDEIASAREQILEEARSRLPVLQTALVATSPATRSGR